MKIIYQGSTAEDTIVEFEDAFEAAFEPQEAERRRMAAMEARGSQPDSSSTFACES
jgi:tRNA U34 5-methylaminomethyl-2-thiouridine-forming methyltransferase MnmC